MSVDEAIKTAQRLGAQKCYLTHLSHRLEHEELDAFLPDFMHPAYDGLTFEVSSDATGVFDGI
jgi:phosphoribosyl 1,2-cyclic phosphate phosphodiesterase